MKLLLVLSALVASAFARPGGCGVRNYGGQGCAYCSDLMNPPESARAYSSTWGHLSNSMLDSGELAYICGKLPHVTLRRESWFFGLKMLQNGF